MAQIPSWIPVKKNFKIWKGADFRYPFQFLTKQNGVTSIQDVTGFTGVMNIVDPATKSSLLTLTTGSGIDFGSAGVITLSIPAVTTAGLTWSQAEYELLITNTVDVPNHTDPLLTGRISVFGL